MAAMGDMEGRKPGPTSILGEWGLRVWGESGGVRGSHTTDTPPQAPRSCGLGSLRAIASPSTPPALAAGPPCVAWPSASGGDRDMGKDSSAGWGHGGTRGDGGTEVSELGGQGQDGGGERGVAELEGTGRRRGWGNRSVREGGMGTWGCRGWGHGGVRAGRDREMEGTGMGTQGCQTWAGMGTWGKRDKAGWGDMAMETRGCQSLGDRDMRVSELEGREHEVMGMG